MIKSKLTIIWISTLLLLPATSVANDNDEIEKPKMIGDYDLINNLNNTLKSKLNLKNNPGINHISTFQKNNQIIIQVTHNPQICYQNLVNKIAETASRVNGVNFQKSFTLDIIDSYCKTDLFYTIQSEGLDNEVIVQYEDLKGNNVALHRINKQLCHL
ncbi:hypothetical protein [Thiomicrorhabdus sp.]|uniref:hypothetical protein n=1 Tax=Thiomicrorhabdus sp. TaxID=2039724 RepID=UPI002AA6C20E|nr:hypothetical protein [Thiomicrorhabdus sp.]